jgi:undecaprenol kinase/diacylglycerol kinase (ATP)
MRYFIRSLRFAINGIYHFFRRERNGQIQGVIGSLAIVAGIFFGLTRTEWMALLLCTALVISLEMLNSAIERICNMYTTEYHPAVKIIKDVAAAAVLWSAIMALIIGVLIFLPHLLVLLRQAGMDV